LAEVASFLKASQAFWTLAGGFPEHFQHSCSQRFPDASGSFLHAFRRLELSRSFPQAVLGSSLQRFQDASKKLPASLLEASHAFC
jgi:hypothetical protein